MIMQVSTTKMVLETYKIVQAGQGTAFSGIWAMQYSLDWDHA